MGRNLRGRLKRLEQEQPPPHEIRWNALFTGDLDAFIASLPSPPVPPPERDHVEDRIAWIEGLGLGTASTV